MGVSLNSALMLYAAGSFLGTISYMVVVIFQQFLGSSLGKLFFTLDYTELMVNACLSGLWALIFMFTGHEKFKNILIALLPGLTYLASIRGGFTSMLGKLDLSSFATYETPLVLAAFCLVWGLGLPKIVGGQG